MAEPGGIERETGKLALARTPFLQTLEADGIAKTHEVRAYIAREQHSSRTPQQGDVSRAMPRSMDNLDAARDRQYFTSGQRLVYGNRRPRFPENFFTGH